MPIDLHSSYMVNDGWAIKLMLLISTWAVMHPYVSCYWSLTARPSSSGPTGHPAIKCLLSCHYSAQFNSTYIC